MTRQKLVEKYEKMMIDEGEIDIWDDEIEPVIDKLSTAKIQRMYNADREYYKWRRTAVSV